MDTDDNITIIHQASHLDHLNEITLPKHALLSVLAVFIIANNSLLIFTILRHKRLYNVTNLFVVALACADLTTGFPSIPIHILGERRLLGDSPTACLLSMAMTSAQIVVSVIMLFALSVERYLKFVHPFKHRRWLTRRRCLCIMAACWVYAMILGILPLLGWNNTSNQRRNVEESSFYIHNTSETHSYDNTMAENDTNPLPITNSSSNTNQWSGDCRFEVVLHGTYIAFLFVGHILPASLFLPVMHVRVFITARSVIKRHARMSSGDQHLAYRARRNLRPFKLLVLMVVYFILSWIPLTIWEIVVFKGFTIPNPDPNQFLTDPFEKYFYYIAVAVATMNSVVNPLFYGLGNKHIWQTFVMSLKATCGREDIDLDDLRFSFASNSQCSNASQHGTIVLQTGGVMSPRNSICSTRHHSCSSNQSSKRASVSSNYSHKRTSVSSYKSSHPNVGPTIRMLSLTQQGARYIVSRPKRKTSSQLPTKGI